MLKSAFENILRLPELELELEWAGREMCREGEGAGVGEGVLGSV